MAEIPARLTDALAGRYRIERLHGSGGMADVYLAQDLKHPRRVAIKVLKPELAALLGRERFLREIELAARLQHPYILALWDSGVAGDLLYYVMPFLEGDTLRQRLEREKQLPLEDALRITGEVAEALDLAHRQGVVHRDIKPENLLFEGGHALVADFGIARAVGLAGGTQLTETGVTIGTAAYMSPEQALGGRDLDGRSDQYSLACVTYEMLAGQPPFTGATAESVVHQHVAAAPRPVTDLRAGVPAGVAAALTRALAKAPADRFGGAGELAEALKIAAAGPKREAGATLVSPLARRRRLALAVAGLVVAAAALFGWWWFEFRGRAAVADPTKKDLILVAQFEGPADDPDLARAVRNMLATVIDQCRIAATVPDADLREALRNAGKPESTKVDATLARELAHRRSIRAILEGQVNRLGAGYSVTARLVDVENSRLLISVGEAAADQRRLVSTVERLGHRLRLALGEQRAALRSSRPLFEVATPDFEAYRLFMRGHEAIVARQTPEATRFLRAATARDPEFAMAWLSLSINYRNEGKRDSSRWGHEQAKHHARRLSEFERSFLDFNECFGLRRDIAAGMEAVERIRSACSTPRELMAYFTARGVVMMAAGRYDDASESHRMAFRQGPFAPDQVRRSNLFITLLSLGQFDEAQSLAQQMTHSEEARARLEVVRERWPQAESLGAAVATRVTVPLRVRLAAAVAAASGSAARGRVAHGTRILDGIRHTAEVAGNTQLARMCRDHEMSIALFAGSTMPPLAIAVADTSLLGSLSLCARLNVVRSRSEAAAALRGLMADPRSEWPEYTVKTALLQGWTALVEGRDEDGTALLRPLAFQPGGPAYFDLDEQRSRQVAQWLMTDLYVRLGRPDSAAICLETMLAPAGRYRDRLPDRGFHFSFAHQRLVLLYARMGRVDAARQHWEVFHKAFDDPDPELRPLLEEARTALASAESMAKSLKR